MMVWHMWGKVDDAMYMLDGKDVGMVYVGWGRFWDGICCLMCMMLQYLLVWEDDGMVYVG